ncbi:hypothetical protein ZIOFF_057297 [Zingiber officinale]|uniref:Uncharacterized protein n=1 Tax=Zingiber officinale TaxID=94328 RepID=A0A8J5F755_ZINOF|nr:hypothetical protein ZIOFF_057297 [Zingiber officinale]
MRNELMRREPRASHPKALRRGGPQAVRWRFDGSKTSIWDRKGGESPDGAWSTNLDSWTSEQLKTMVFGGNNWAQVFFKQHGWTDGGKTEAKYPKDNMNDEKPKPETTHSPEAPIRSTVLSSIKKPIGTKKTGGKTGGLGVKKLTTKPNESLYDQRPEEPAPAATSLAKSKITDVPSFPSQFEYVENTAIDNNAGGAQVIEHVAPPKSLSFFAEFGVDSGFQKKLSSTSSKVQESNEARQKFSNVKSISSAQFFGENKTSSENETHRTLQRFTVSASEDLSSLTNIAGETRKKLTSIASSLIYDLQDRIL